MRPPMTAERDDVRSRLRRMIIEKQSQILAIVVLVFMLGAFEIGPMLGFRPQAVVARLPMPALFDSLGARWVLVFFLFVFAIFTVAVLLKSLEQVEITHWQAADAEITRSEPGFRLITPAKGMPRNHRIANIGYRFEAAGPDGKPRTFGGGRIRIDEIIPEEEVEALLARYPLGRRVTVFYDPQKPSSNVLEREADGGRTVRGMAALAAVFAVIAVPVMAFATHGASVLSAIPLKPWGWVSLITGLVSAGFVFGETRQRRWLASLAPWPRVRGEVVSSSVEPFDGGHRRSWYNGMIQEVVHSYMPVVEYRYTVDGRNYLSRNIQADMTIAGSERYAQRYVDRFAPGTIVDVMHDPENPARAALETTSGFGWTLIIAAIGFAVVSAFAAFKAFA